MIAAIMQGNSEALSASVLSVSKRLISSQRFRCVFDFGGASFRETEPPGPERPFFSSSSSIFLLLYLQIGGWRLSREAKHRRPGPAGRSAVQRPDRSLGSLASIAPFRSRIYLLPLDPIANPTRSSSQAIVLRKPGRL